MAWLRSTATCSVSDRFCSMRCYCDSWPSTQLIRRLIEHPPIVLPRLSNVLRSWNGARMTADERSRRPIHQFIPLLTYGDAMSNHAIELRKVFGRWGHPSEIYVETCDRRVARHCQHYTTYHDDPGDILIYQYGLGSSLTDFLASRLGRTILYYHNVTPPEFFELGDPEFAATLRQGRDDLCRLAERVKGVLTDSEYNRQDLLRMGFGSVTVMPLLLDLATLEASANCAAGRRTRNQFNDDCVNILFVGRLSPNKRQEDLLQALAYYRAVIDTRVRLLLVGGWRNFRYRARLEVLAEHLNVAPYVHFSGHLEMEAGFGGYYGAATVFLSLSEHEGFGIPLVESMHFNVPIVAYASSAVPETLGGCGLLVTQKRYDVIGELIHLLAVDSTFRDQVVRAQRKRLADFRRDVVEAQIRQWMAPLDEW